MVYLQTKFQMIFASFSFIITILPKVLNIDFVSIKTL
jgi:hypothetical protein